MRILDNRLHLIERVLMHLLKHGGGTPTNVGLICDCVVSGKPLPLVLENIDANAFDTFILQPFVHLIQHGLRGGAERLV